MAASVATMDIDATNTTATSGAAHGPGGSGGSGLIVSLHPLVIMNISDHFVRVKSQTGESTPVYGALIGEQSGREVEISNSYELATLPSGDGGAPFFEYNESPLLLLLNPAVPSASRDLPVEVFEPVVDIVEGRPGPQTAFLALQYKIETGEAERIAVDHVAQTTGADATNGSSREF
ncbi:COP9 signalosome complex subunit 6 [Cladochytrium tenue]|nr:COP9 signalosome complex subunit 6 [Cladochytrium tenue]